VSAGNLGPRESRKRMIFGWAMLAAGLGATAGLNYYRAGVYWRLLVFFPFWLATLGLLQGREKT